jgi:uncharacterized protein
VADRERIQSLDILRGFALLGILAMNITSFALIDAAYFNPMAYGEPGPVDTAVWYLHAMLADTKFMAVFSMLFGASMLLLIEKIRARGGRPFNVLSRRYLFLLAVGFVHGRFLWHGDILWAYAVSAFAIFLFRNRGPKLLITVGVLMMVWGSAQMTGLGLIADEWDDASRTEQYEQWQPSAEAIEEEVADMRGSWLDQQQHRGPAATEGQTTVLIFYTFWRSAGMMLIGMGLYRLGVLTGRRSRRVYLWMLVLGFGLGLPLNHLRVWGSYAAEWDAIESFFLWFQFNYWGSVGVALGYVALVMLACQSPKWRPRLEFLAPVGRMAFSNYIGQTLIATSIFYGHGLGWFSRFDRLELLGFVVAIWIVQIYGSRWWLARFRYGPLEWVWRMVTNLEVPPVRA